MAWTFLLLAGIMEIGWPVGFRNAWGEDGAIRWKWVFFGLACAVTSGFFLFLAQRTIPMGTAYAVWTGIGAVGAFTVGLLFFKEPAETARIVCVLLIACGIIGLKIFSSDGQVKPSNSAISKTSSLSS